MFNIFRHINKKIWLSLAVLFVIPLTVQLVRTSQQPTFLPQASEPTPSGIASCQPYDLNCDGQICLSEASLIRLNFNQAAENCLTSPGLLCRLDLNHDRLINGADLSIFLNQVQLEDC